MVRKVVASLVLCLTIAAIGGWVTIPALPQWYLTLKKPFFTPPDWVFSPVWTVLYILMAFAFAIVWERAKKQKSAVWGMRLFVLQLIVNLLWSILFFGLRSPQWALLDIVVLWLLIVATLSQFWRVHLATGYLLLPYLAWVSYAALLNYAIVYLN